ncbi:hypothetical protein HGB25_01610 [Candidatus Saccharibacteria bacterium]|nr:hypothetical protein [Candidatus Saccharibacteria bacterium]
MKLKSVAGFTIIETMLFLGISGALAMIIIVGTSTSINTQRYRDSVSSLRAFFQQQYSDVANVNNGTTGNSCPGDSASGRGQSNCVILGRFIVSKDSGSITSKTITGKDPGSSPTDDLDAFEKYGIQVSASIPENTYTIEWGSTMKQENTTSDSRFSILILRSPLTGVIRTFIDGNSVISDSHITDLLVNSAMQTNASVMCVDSNGMTNGHKMAVKVGPGATSASSVEILGDDSPCL